MMVLEAPPISVTRMFFTIYYIGPRDRVEAQQAGDEPQQLGFYVQYAKRGWTKDSKGSRYTKAKRFGSMKAAENYIERTVTRLCKPSEIIMSETIDRT